MKLCIAEKPSVAREIAKILGANTKRNGYLEGNGYYVTWTFGHLCELKEPHEYNKDWKRWAISYLPMIPKKFGIKLKTNSGIAEQFKVIEELISKSDEVINCGDAAQEGELIQRWVLQLAKCDKPIKRLWISSLTEEAMKEGFENLRDGKDFDRLYAAGSMRAIGDWLLGLNATRLYTLKYGNGKDVLSVGRVQTPTLSLIVERQKEIENFTPETYFELKTIYKDTEFSATKKKFKESEKEKGELLVNELKEKDLEITSFIRKKGKEAPQKLFDLTALQVEGNKKYGFSADETLKYIQGLYEKKLTTYPRVDTTYLPDDVYPKVKGILEKLEFYKAMTEPILKDKIRKSKKVFDNTKITDHHAIIPTGVVPNNLSLQEKQVYDMVTQRFISVFYPDCIVSNTTVMAKVDKTEFKATGKQILDQGWRILYKKDDKKDANSDLNSNSDARSKASTSDAVMPDFVKGEKGPHKPSLKEKTTTPPKYYTEATLLRAMETAGKQIDSEELRELMKENGIGRPSTRAAIIETLFRRRYITRERKNLLATVTGVQLIETISSDLLKSAELTGIWEKKLRQIEKGEIEIPKFMQELKVMVSEVVESVKNSVFKKIEIIADPNEKDEKTKSKTEIKKRSSKVEYDNENAIICPKCKNGKMIRGKKAYGCSSWKDGCKFLIQFEIYGKKLSEKQAFALLTKRKTGKISGFKLNDKKITAKLYLDEEFRIKFDKEN